MRRRALRQAAAAVAFVWLAGPLVAGDEHGIANTRVLTRSAAAGLAAAVSAELRGRSGPAWIGWSVPTSLEHSSCCWSSDAAGGASFCGCRLEGRGDFVAGRGEPVRLEGAARVRVLLRAEGGRVAKVRAFSEDCPLDASGLTVVWIEDVRPKDSVALLASILRDDTDRKLREDTIFALSLSREPEAVDAIVDAARRDPDSHVRGQALFWLAQTASRRAAAAIQAALDDDPEVGVKKKAVFALSQLPKDEGVPLLIGVAKTHASAEVRKQAMFWLGQSGDPRALAFFEDVLGR